MARPHSPAKLTAPRLARVLRRQALFCQLDEGRLGERVLWIEAPPGMGKTTLVASWLGERRYRHLWLQLDEADADVAGFFHCLEMAERRRAGHSHLPAFAPEHHVAPHLFSRIFFRSLCAAPAPPQVVVLDDYHRLGPDTPVHAAVAAGLAELPGGVTAIVLSRSPPPAALARLRASGAIRHLNTRGLALSEEEAVEIARLWGFTGPDLDTVRALHDRVEGWAAGLVLLLGAARLSEGRPLEWDGRQPIVDYFAEEVFSLVDPRTRQVLLETAFLPRVSEEMAVRVTGVANAGEILADVARRGYFVARHGADPPVYQFHALFRDFLLGRAERDLPADRQAELRRVAAGLLDASGQVDDALGLWGEAGAWGDVRRVVCRDAPALLGAGRAETVAARIEAIPAEERDGDPWMLFFLGSARALLGLRGGRIQLEAALERFQATGDAPGAYLAWAAVVEESLLAFQDLSTLDRSIAVLEVLRARHPDWPTAEAEARVVAAAVGALSHRQPWHPMLPSWLAHGMRIALSPGDAGLRVSVGRALALHYGGWGVDVERSRLVLEALWPVASSALADPAATITWHAAAGVTEAGSGRLDLAERAAEEGLAISARTGLHHLDLVLLQVRVLCASSRGDLATASAILGQMSGALSSPSLLARCVFHHLASHLARLRGHLDRARRQGQMAVELARAIGCPIAEVFYGIPAALAAPREALRAELERTLRDAVRCDVRSVQAGCLCALGLEAMREGTVSKGAALLRDGLAIARDIGVGRMYWFSREETAEYCGYALAHGIETEFVEDVVRDQRLVPGPNAQAIEAWPWDVRITTIGELGVIRDRERVRPGRKAQKKPMELLRLLVDRGPAGVHPSVAADALWPDSEGDAAHHALGTTVYRLRKLLGRAEAVAHQDGHVALDPRWVFVDAWARGAESHRDLGVGARTPVVGTSGRLPSPGARQLEEA